MIINTLQFIYISFLSTFLHFSYDMTNHIFLFSIIGAVNESTWEHLKIGIFPWFTWFLIRSHYFSIINSYFSNFIAILSFMITIVVIFYGSNYILKKHYLPISISSFYIGILSGICFEYKIKKENIFHPVLEIIGLIGCILIIIAGLILTYYPIKCFLTLDVRYNMYGIEAHRKRCDILEKKKYIIFIFNLLRIPLDNKEYEIKTVKTFELDHEEILEENK